MANEDILDFLTSKNEPDKEIITEEVCIPIKCAKCNMAVICSVVPTFINLSKIKILVSVEQCPFSKPKKTQ